jgi:ferric-dicitrate binding protein FerR (iron transport regulator)
VDVQTVQQVIGAPVFGRAAIRGREHIAVPDGDSRQRGATSPQKEHTMKSLTISQAKKNLAAAKSEWKRTEKAHRRAVANLKAAKAALQNVGTPETDLNPTARCAYCGKEVRATFALEHLGFFANRHMTLTADGSMRCIGSGSRVSV